MTFDYPHPRLKHLLHGLLDENGALMAYLLMQAIEQFSLEVAELDPDQVTKETHGWVDGRAWIACAKTVLEALEDFKAPAAAEEDKDNEEVVL
jgi:hypothetical protein